MAGGQVPANLEPQAPVRALMQLTFGGLGTTAASLANIVRRLAENPDLQDRLRADHELLPKAIEELMRYDTFVIVMARTATHDVEIEHAAVPAGDKVLVYFAGANRDPRQFTTPDEIDIDRVPNRHLVFGAGNGQVFESAADRGIRRGIHAPFPQCDQGILCAEPCCSCRQVGQGSKSCLC